MMGACQPPMLSTIAWKSKPETHQASMELEFFFTLLNLPEVHRSIHRNLYSRHLTENKKQAVMILQELSCLVLQGRVNRGMCTHNSLELFMEIQQTQGWTHWGCFANKSQCEHREKVNTRRHKINRIHSRLARALSDVQHVLTVWLRWYTRYVYFSGANVSQMLLKCTHFFNLTSCKFVYVIIVMWWPTWDLSPMAPDPHVLESVLWFIVILTVPLQTYQIAFYSFTCQK